MTKRILKQTLKNGDIEYVVETNRLFGFIPVKWHTDLIYDGELDMHVGAIFTSYEEACVHAGFTIPDLEVVKSEIIKEE